MTKDKSPTLSELLTQSDDGQRLLARLRASLEFQPEPERTDLAAALDSENDVEFYSAELELVLGEMLAQRGWDFTRHPELPDTARRPDFGVNPGASMGDFFIEARMSIDLNMLKRDRLMRALMEALETVTGPETISLTIEGELPGDLSVRQATAAVANCITELREAGHPTTPKLAYQQGSFRLVAKVLDVDNEDLGPVVASYQFGSTARTVTTRDSLDRVIAKKAGRYGLLGRPFVIAVAARHEFPLRKHGVATTLYGTRQLDFADPEDPSEPLKFMGERYSRDGIFTAVKDGEPIRTRVSAVVVYDRSGTSEELESQLAILHNPFAEYPLDRSLFSGYPQFDVKDDGNEEITTLTWDRDPPEWWG